MTIDLDAVMTELNKAIQEAVKIAKKPEENFDTGKVRGLLLARDIILKHMKD